MEWLWDEHGEKVYEPGFLKEQAKAITAWCEEQGITLNAKQRGKLTDTKYWKQPARPAGARPPADGATSAPRRRPISTPSATA